jgi:hypothetical protein
MEHRPDTPVDQAPEGLPWPYMLLNGFAVLSAIAGIFYLGLGLFVCLSGKSQAGRAFSAGLLAVVGALLLWAICDLAVRLRRIECEQRQIRHLLAQQFRPDP